MDLNEIGHNLNLVTSNLLLDGSHNGDLDTDGTLSHRDVPHGGVDEFLNGLTGGDKITLGVFGGLCSLSSNLTGNNDSATNSVSSHDTTHDVVDGSSNWDSIKKLHLEVLDVGGSAESSITNWEDGHINFVVSIVEVISLLDE